MSEAPCSLSPVPGGHPSLKNKKRETNMGRVGFKAENKVATTNYDYPKLKLKVGERARIMVGLEDPIVEYVHTLRKPQIINGVPQMETVKSRSGAESQANVMDFVSRPLCIGDKTILDDKGSDPKNCPMCKLAQEHPDYTKPPQRRYAMHVIRYRTKGGTTEVATPFSVETLVWAFTDTVFNKIVDAAEEFGDLRKHDLLLGPCQAPEHFQKFDISPAAKAAWLESAERKQLTVQTFKENQIPDLTIAAGSAKQKQWIEEDIQSIKDAWAEVSGASADVDVDLDTDLGSLLDGDTDAEGWSTPAAAKEAGVAADADDLLGDLDDLVNGDDEDTSLDPDEDEVTEEKPAPKKAARKPAAKKASESVEEPETTDGSSDDPDNFDDLLADL